MNPDDDYFVSTDPGLLDLEFIHRQLQGSYWAATRPRETIAGSIRHSLCFGVYEKASRRQVGFARIVTDQNTFSWLCDVIIDSAHRRQGLGKYLMSCVVAHPTIKRTMCLLGTADAHGLYEQYGFKRWEMMKRLPDRPGGDRGATPPTDAGRA